MGKLRRRFMQAWLGIARNLETGYHEDRHESLNIVLANEIELPKLLQNVNALNAVQQYPLGCRLQCGERVWRYAHILAAGAAGQRGRAAVCTDAGVERGAFYGAIVAGAYTVNWTSVAAIAADHYRGGYALMQGGFVHKIAHNTVSAAPGAVIILTFYEPFQAIEALPAGRTGLLLENPYANVNAYGPAPGSGNGRVMGVFMAETVVNMFTWLQTWGPSGLIVTGTIGTNNAEIVITRNIAISDECLPHVGVVGNDGLQVIGEVFTGGGTDSWDGENFINCWLTIDP